MASGRKLLTILGVIIGGFVLLIASIVTAIFVGQRNTERAITPRIETMFSAMEHGTFAETYDTETSSAMRQAVNREEFSELGDAVANLLGPLKSKQLRGFRFSKTTQGTFVEASYDATFAKGIGEILANLSKEDGEWKFNSLRVNSPVFEQDFVSRKCPTCGKAIATSARFCPACGVAIAGKDEIDVEASPDPSPTRSDSGEGQK